MDRAVFFLYAESQIHAGKGADVGIVDLPIQRERTTDFPVIQGIKGSLRNSGLFKDEEEQIFGSKPKNDETQPGGFAFSEAKILLFPVRSPERVFVWVTCPMVLKRFLRSIGKDIEIPEASDDEKVVAAGGFENIWLEELEFEVINDSKLNQVIEILSNCGPDEYIQKKIREKKDVFIISDKIFQKMVKTMTEIVPRIRICEKTGTVAEGALWYEEYLPQDTVMYFVVRKLNSNKIDNLTGKINEKIIAIGGKETVGKGLAWIKKVES